MFFPGPTTAAVSATSSSRTNNNTTTNNVMVIGGLIIVLPVAIATGYVLGSSSSSGANTIHEGQEEEEDETGDDDNDDNKLPLPPINMTGSYKVIANQHFDEFLKAQGVPWFLCNAASKARPTHTFTHSSSSSSTTNNLITIHIKGIIDSETTYDIGSGSYNITTIRGRTFHDTVTYLYDDNEEAENENENENDEEENDEIASNTSITSSDDSDRIIDKHDSSSSSSNNNNKNKKNCIGIQTHKLAIGEGYKVHVQRRFIKAGTTYNSPTTSTDGSSTSTTTNKDHTYDLQDLCNNDRLLMLNKIIFDDPTKETVIASQLFHKI
ncbi:hypothetical protein FRACYDRAFT_254414 [Fragilariopsis cylindrus CCMP1102]|uniref:Uncharacterized protein n=1 Tax=Fragilariopsis cylindrus CCMP1102 TaxID=635003 RepID=A0A1E7EKW7_9STRA|nr:hypothetical protein FRACYDRAFT_254414 [Fragilariopsis cylindrus CCMP1102]|eukprot:OEU06561.1 hypothetical protein FRACYDRAFT_254414 [Fragilariopsis cylindrus CCMP1102]